MDDQQLFTELLHAAEKLGVEVRIEPFETPAIAGGGLCLFRGETLVLLDACAPLRGRVVALAQALSKLDTETIYLTPLARDLVETLRPVSSA
jgi:hypothetical protein